jgi:adenine-specific DNA-methyltransferase
MGAPPAGTGKIWTLMNFFETQRLEIQANLDGKKTSAARNKLGQFATPTILAQAMLRYGLSLLDPATPVRFFDPAIGTGAFYSALRSVCGSRHVDSAQGFEIDPHYGIPAKELWRDTQLEITLGDFTKATPPKSDSARPTLLICNPPYVRHHHFDSQEKIRLNLASNHSANVNLSGLAGLYIYFMALANAWMPEGGVAGWLIPSEFMDVNYGRELKRHLCRDITLLHIHRFDPNDVQFEDALVSSAVVWIRKSQPPKDHRVLFSYGGTLEHPKVSKYIALVDLAPSDKWTRYPNKEIPLAHHGYRLSDLFSVKRGLATGNNSFFIMDEERANSLNIPRQFLRPILPSTRYICADEIEADSNGIPLLERRLLLLDCDLPEEDIQRDYPSLWTYLQTGQGSTSDAYLCKSRKRWYMQERRPASPIVCTYIGRSDRVGRPFRFILNNSNATATNVYLMLYPTPLLQLQLQNDPGLLRRLWQALNRICPEVLLGNGRVYGGGMHKLEPKELANVPVDELAEIGGLPLRNNPGQLTLAI